MKGIENVIIIEVFEARRRNSMAGDHAYISLGYFATERAAADELMKHGERWGGEVRPVQAVIRDNKKVQLLGATVTVYQDSTDKVRAEALAQLTPVQRAALGYPEEL